MMTVLIGTLILIAAVVMVVVVVVVSTIRARIIVIRVSGQSMAPTLRSGDRLLVRRGPGVEPRVGDLVVLPEPGPCRRGEPARREAASALIVKRVAAVPGDPVPAFLPAWERAGGVVPPGRLVLLGDNPPMSRDSRQFGQVRADRLIGVVVRRLGGHALPTAGSGR